MSLRINDPLEGTPFALNVEERVENNNKRKKKADEDIRAEIARLRAENEALKAKKEAKAPEKVSSEPKQDDVKAIAQAFMSGGRSAKLPDVPKAEVAPEPKPQPKPVINAHAGHHMIDADGKVYADTSFMYCIEKLGGEMKHMGFGDFDGVFPDGKAIQFVRYDEYPIPGKVGRAHQLRGDADKIKWLLGEAVTKGLSLDMTGVQNVTEQEPVVVFPTPSELPVSTPAENEPEPEAPEEEPEAEPVEATTVVKVDFREREVKDTSNWPSWRKRMYGIK